MSSLLNVSYPLVICLELKKIYICLLVSKYKYYCLYLYIICKLN